ncbi:MAG TPA: helix-turn-helix domain-containing protein [Gaiellaceae bacterium]|nr:helix-turn-helix domain-containing protein [Gaiellaceae bacterium]
MPKVSREHAEARREQILGGARRCFARWGYDGATVPRLEREIGLSHGAIFNYYPSKLDLFLALAKEDHTRFHEIWHREGFEGLARHIADADPAWLSIYLELHRRLYTDASLRKKWRALRLEEPPPATDERALVLAILNGLVFARASGAEVDVEPILRLTKKLFDR